MHLRYLLLLLAFAVASYAAAQNTILHIDESEILARITEIHPSEVWYYPYGDADSLLQTLPKQEIIYIIYQDGMKQYFAVDASRSEIVPLPDSIDLENLYMIGLRDAERYYDSKGAMWGTFAATVYYPFLGALSGAMVVGIIAAVPPNPRLEQLPNPELYNYPMYASGYNREAKKRKTLRALAGYGMGMGLHALLFVWVLVGVFL
ncbi:MAG: hypothetical protein OHK0039_12740 [Bacteroidia bacterium]